MSTWKALYSDSQVFQWFERPHELEQSSILQARVIESRDKLTSLCHEVHTLKKHELSNFQLFITDYEEALQVCYVIVTIGV